MRGNGDMKKLIVTAAVLAGVAYLAKRFGPKCMNVDWQTRFESLPDNAPPKWMFRNISEIHDNTERILAMLESRADTRRDDQLPGHVAPPGVG
jgi:hypothetical protein